MGGGRERGGPTRAQPYASFMRTPEDTHLPVGGVRRAILSYGVLYICTPHHELARTQWPCVAIMHPGALIQEQTCGCRRSADLPASVLAWLPLGRRCRSLPVRPGFSCSCRSCLCCNCAFEDIRDACFEPLLRGERAPGCAGVQEDLAVATLLCCSPG